jgi:hypothetical protein
MINDIIVETAKSYIGQEEILGNLGFKNSDFENKMKSVGWQKTQAWCSYFTELIWKQAYGKINKQDIIKELNLLFDGSAVKTYNNFKNKFIVSKEPIDGSIVIWQHYSNSEPGWTGHAGIVVDILDNSIKTIEGNTNNDGSREGYMVCEKIRPLNFNPVKNGLVLRGFIYPK